MAYMIEGGGSKTFAASKSWLYRYPSESHRLLDLLTDVLAEFLIAQIEAGAQLVQVFDSWAGLLGPAQFEAFALPYLRELARRVGEACPDVPRTLFARGANYALPALAESGYEVIGLDWSIDPGVARALVGDRVALQGNLDPVALFAPPDVIRSEVRAMLEAFGPHGHIANLGHGMMPEHDPEHAGCFVEAVHTYSRALRETTARM
jgi:uroporphyrinogen decarboxylase